MEEGCAGCTEQEIEYLEREFPRRSMALETAKIQIAWRVMITFEVLHTC